MTKDGGIVAYKMKQGIIFSQSTPHPENRQALDLTGVRNIQILSKSFA